MDTGLANYLRSISHYPLLSPAEEQAVISRAQLGDETAQQELAEANLRLVVVIARRFMHWGVPLDELIAEGNLGLMQALDGFDPTRNLRFGAYAGAWIRFAIQHRVFRQTRVVKLPTGLEQLWLRHRQALESLRHRLERLPTVAEAAASTGLTPRLAGLLIQVGLQPPANDASWIDQIADEEPSPDESLQTEDQAAQLNQLTQDLPAREALAVRLHFGLEDGLPLTFAQIGERMGVTRQRVRQIVQHALDRLKTKLRQRARLAEYHGISGAKHNSDLCQPASAKIA